MVPAKFVACAVAMLTDAVAEFFYFRNEFFTGHLFQVFIHDLYYYTAACVV